MISTLRNIRAGFMAGIRAKDKSFLGILVICLLIVPLMLALNAKVTGTDITSASLAAIGPALWVSVVFFAYLLAVTSLRVFHLGQGAPEKAKKLLVQFDFVVSAVMIGTVVSLVMA